PYRVLTNVPDFLLMNLVGSVPSTTAGRRTLQEWLGRPMRLKITDGRILVGFFACTDRDVNILLTKCRSYRDKEGQDSQFMGTVLVASKHIVSICIDQPSNN
ncbi:hypothetical protein KR054_006669, partial [Drosophila jambulina]